jgi:hypothetical protein
MTATADATITRELALASIRGARRRRYIATVLTAFGDESHDEHSNRVFAVSGLIGRQDEWNELEIAWQKRTGGVIFHAADCESDQGDFAKFSHTANLKLYADLVSILAGTKVLGIAVAIDLAAFTEIFPDAQPDQPYFLCFHDVVYELAGIAHLHVPQEVAKFTFDRNFDVEYNATYLYDYMTKHKEWDLVEAIHSHITFATRAEVGIQAADLLARETMKQRDNQIGPVKRNTRRSMTALANTNRFRFWYHTWDSLLAMRQQAADLGSLKGAKMTEYRAWIERNKVPDSFSTRIKYLMVIDALNKVPGASGR